MPRSLTRTDVDAGAARRWRCRIRAPARITSARRGSRPAMRFALDLGRVRQARDLRRRARRGSARSRGRASGRRRQAPAPSPPARSRCRRRRPAARGTAPRSPSSGASAPVISSRDGGELAARGGSVRMCRSVRRTEPSGKLVRRRTTPRSATMISVEPPPMSTTTSGSVARGGRGERLGDGAKGQRRLARAVDDLDGAAEDLARRIEEGARVGRAAQRLGADGRDGVGAVPWTAAIERVLAQRRPASPRCRRRPARRRRRCRARAA